MATAKEKELLGLPANATDDQVEDRITELVTAPNRAASTSAEHKISLLSITGRDLNRGHLVIPPVGSEPLVLPLSYFDTPERLVDLGEIMGSPHVQVVRTDSAVTPAVAIRTYV